jgi:Double-GTPase 1
MSGPPTISMLGGAGTGKTHFGGQLIGRLRQRQGILRLLRAPTERTVFDEVQQRLQEGRTADHTPTTQYREERLPISDAAGTEFDLVWADYGGEQLDRVIEARAVSHQWQKRLASASGWLLFLRLGSVTVYRTDAARLESSAEDRNAPPPIGWDGNARLVELLQILVHAGELSIARPLMRPRLAVALSCWDELDSQVAPRAELWARVPFVAAFLEANWRSESLSIWGLSSLGKALRKDIADDEYLERGPEEFGYVVREDGRHSADLSEPISWLISGK